MARYDGPANSDDGATALAVDAAGNVYVTGGSAGSSGTDYATIKYDPDGNELWVARYDGPAHYDDIAEDLAVDSMDNVYVTGVNRSLYGNGYIRTDYATIKYDPDGNELVSVHGNN
jgi:hypothetical protein